MKTAVYENYKPTDALSASGFIAGLLPDYGLVSNGIYIEMITKLVLVDARGSLILCTTFKVRVSIQIDS